jgi:hypothetical protein
MVTESDECKSTSSHEATSGEGRNPRYDPTLDSLLSKGGAEFAKGATADVDILCQVP